MILSYVQNNLKTPQFDIQRKTKIAVQIELADAEAAYQEAEQEVQVKMQQMAECQQAKHAARNLKVNLSALQCFLYAWQLLVVYLLTSVGQHHQF